MTPLPVQEVSHVEFMGLDLRGRPFRSAKIPIRPGPPAKPPQVVFQAPVHVVVDRVLLLNPFGSPVWTERFTDPVKLTVDKQLRLDIADAILVRFNGKVVIPFFN